MKIQSFTLVSVMLLVALDASADQFNWGNTYAQAWQGFGASPYTAIDTQTGKTITIFCLDYNDEIAPPNTWNANVWALNPQNIQTQAQYGGNYNNLLNQAYAVANPGKNAPNQIANAPFSFNGDDGGINNGVDYSVNLLQNSQSPSTRYLEAAWLFSEMTAPGVDVHSNLALVAQVAAWELFVNSYNVAGSSTLTNIQDLHNRIVATNGNNNFGFQDFVDSPGNAVNTVSGLDFEQAVDYALAAAQSAVVSNTFNFNTMGNWSLVTGDPTWIESNAGRQIPVQEFLSPDATPGFAPTPEPTAIILLGTILLTIGFLKQRKAA